MAEPSKRIDAHFVAAGKYHDIDFARMEVLKLLATHPRVRTTVAADYSGLERLDECRFLVTYTCDLMPTEDQARQLRAWLEAGGKWLALHGTNSILQFTEDGLVATPEDRDDFMELVGTQFKAHPPIGQMDVEVVNRDHELTQGIDDFSIVDELYLSRTTAPIDILMRTRFDGEATGFVDADWKDAEVPILYTREHGEGCVVYNTLGHCRGHYDVPMLEPFFAHPERCAWDYEVYYDMLRRSIAWAMRD